MVDSIQLTEANKNSSAEIDAVHEPQNDNKNEYAGVQ